MRRRLTPLVLAVLLMASTVLLASGAAQPRRTASDAAAWRDGFTTNPMRGIAQPSRTAVIYPQIDGLLVELLVDDNQRVEEDQVIARLDDRLQQVTVDMNRLRAESKSAIENAQLAVEFAEVNLDSVKTAFENAGATKLELRRAQLEHKQALNNLQAAKEEQQLAEVQLRGAEVELSRYLIKAPFTGRMLRMQVENGVSVKRETEIATLVALHPLEALMFIPAGLSNEFTEGRRFVLEARLETLGGYEARPLVGTVKTREPLRDAASRTVRVKITVPNEDESLDAGFQIFVAGQADAIVRIPAERREELIIGDSYHLAGPNRSELRGVLTATREEQIGDATVIEAVFDVSASPIPLPVGAAASYIAPATE